MLTTKLQSSLYTIFADAEPCGYPIRSGTALQGEVYAYQVVYKYDGHPVRHVRVGVESDIADCVTIREIGLVPVTLAAYADSDADMLRRAAGMFPDPLYPITDDGITLTPHNWRGIWVTVRNAPVGRHNIAITFMSPDGSVTHQSDAFEMEVLPAQPLPQELIFTNWLHCDGLCKWYEVDPFTEGFWHVLRMYMRNAAAHGMNMVLTPIFTPPLDTAVGGERMTTQLIRVTQRGDSYSFDFTLLGRWIDEVSACGIAYFELSHLFTQWGAYHAPKVMATVGGEVRRIFGWDTDATGDAYQAFLTALLPQLRAYLVERGVYERCYFHVSDEPSLEHLEQYERAADIAHSLLPDAKCMDALSSYEFYAKGVVKLPIPATNHIAPFLENHVDGLWTYYCCGQYVGVSNRFMAMPGIRNRILGYHLFKHNIAGFLHWGYNFWNSHLSEHPIDPFKVTDAGGMFPSGDPFVVYPSDDGVIDALRWEVFYDGLQDLNALRTLAQRIGYDAVVKLAESYIGDVDISRSMADEKAYLDMRDDVNRRIAAV